MRLEGGAVTAPRFHVPTPPLSLLLRCLSALLFDLSGSARRRCV
jgi:hypothetical protein